MSRRLKSSCTVRNSIFSVISVSAALLILLVYSGFVESENKNQKPTVRSLPTQSTQSKYTICTYFEPLGLNEENDNKTREMVDMWRESWARSGWDTRVLTSKDAALHPRYNEIMKSLYKLPTVNAQVYEMACYVRWVAAIAAGCKWMSDMDMINYGFPAQEHWKGDVLHSFEGHTPSLVTGDTAAFERVLNVFLAVAAAAPNDTAIIDIGGKPHTSDMLILSTHRDLFVDTRYPAHLKRDNPFVNFTGLVHYAAMDIHLYAGPGLSKIEFARSFRPLNQLG